MPVPRTIQNSEEYAQRIWEEAHKNAVKTYGEGGRAYRVAYAALKHEYEKQGDRWVRKAEKGPSDPQAARGPTTEHTSYGEPPAPTARGKVVEPKETPKAKKEAKAKAREAQKEAAEARKHR
ncbi:ChaB protein [Thermosporothrix hazakensis]|jgi:cation transport regulator ChaB|uniref:ChaB protein n=1 Tax=Thermosporothrix hazakensis TaxID=644383 RepID=A0A326U991_THEHA|nr:ChaB family protein [Thermosporothrix hazakensis]PZW31216.1 ChaB protein [Thermosporothrix hazakensis]GCE50875.1 hypothetical protein KTH_57440 [Thermosporothrix hazakensis]